MAYSGRHNIYRATIRRMVSEVLELQEQEFRKEHASDTNEQLLSYLMRCASDLQHSPWPGEIVGGSVIEERFGTWKQALLLVRLPEPPPDSQKNVNARVLEETERQKQIYRQRKAEKRDLVQKRQAQQATKKKQKE